MRAFHYVCKAPSSSLKPTSGTDTKKFLVQQSVVLVV